jgi:hypothetical protein
LNDKVSSLINFLSEFKWKYRYYLLIVFFFTCKNCKVYKSSKLIKRDIIPLCLAIHFQEKNTQMKMAMAPTITDILMITFMFLLLPATKKIYWWLFGKNAMEIWKKKKNLSIFSHTDTDLHVSTLVMHTWQTKN